MKLSNGVSQHLSRSAEAAQPLERPRAGGGSASTPVRCSAADAVSAPVKSLGVGLERSPSIGRNTINPAHGRLNDIEPIKLRSQDNSLSRLGATVSATHRNTDDVRQPLRVRILNFPPFGAAPAVSGANRVAVDAAASEKKYGASQVTVREALNTLVGGLSKHRKLAFVEFMNDLRQGSRGSQVLSYNDFGSITIDSKNNKVNLYLDTDNTPDTKISVSGDEFFQMVSEAQQAYGTKLANFAQPCGDKESATIQKIANAVGQDLPVSRLA